MKARGAVALVTGANRGLGRAYAQALIAAGAAKVYAAARDPSSIDLPGVVPLKLDVTDPAQVAEAARSAPDVNLLVNNAGIARIGSFFSEQGVQAARDQLETNYFGTLNVSRAFAPVLKANGGGALVNVLSIASWISSELLGPYAASKAAAWSLTNALRQHLRGQGTQVAGVHVSFIDTDLTKGLDVPKLNAADVARLTLEGIDADLDEILIDDQTRQVKRSLGSDQAAYLAPR